VYGSSWISPSWVPSNSSQRGCQHIESELTYFSPMLKQINFHHVKE
jgi:hypothetical protein